VDQSPYPRHTTTTRQDLTLDLALRLIDGACQEAVRRSVSMGLAVVDTAGGVVASARMDGAQLVAVDLATDKAYTAVAFGQPTEAWSASTQPGGLGLGAVHHPGADALVGFAGWAAGARSTASVVGVDRRERLGRQRRPGLRQPAGRRRTAE
jgi:uncharacterized protein GlcG (DUF336 family)